MAGGAISSYYNHISNQRLENAANQIFADLKQAKSEALKQKKTIFVSFKGENKNWCYGINEDLPCDCTKKDVCLLKGSERIISNNNFEGIELQSARFAGDSTSTAFDPNRGFAIGNGVKNGTIWLKAKNDSQVAIIINRIGRVRFCSKDLNGFSTNCPRMPD